MNDNIDHIWVGGDRRIKTLPENLIILYTQLTKVNRCIKYFLKSVIKYRSMITQEKWDIERKEISEFDFHSELCKEITEKKY